MNHLSLHLTASSEERITQRHSLRLIARSEAMTHIALHLTSSSKDNDSYFFTSNSEVRSKENIYTPPFREGPFGLYQAYLESVQTLHKIEA